MSPKRACIATALAVFISTTAQAATIIEFNLTGLTTTAPASASATTVATGVTADTLTRGPGVNPAGLTNGFSSDNWTLGSSDATAIANGDYYQWGFDVDATHSVSVTTFETNLRRSALDAPNNFRLYASLDDFTTAGTLVASFQYFGRSSGTAPGTITQYQWMTTDTPGQGNGNPIQPQDLSGASILQNIAPGSSVQFRLYVWGNNAGAADTNTVALGRVNGPKLSGEIVEIPEPTAIMLVGIASLMGCMARRRG